MAANAPTALCPASRERSTETARGVTHPRGFDVSAWRDRRRRAPPAGPRRTWRALQLSPWSRLSQRRPAAIAAGEGADLDAVVEDASNSPLRRMRRQGHTARVVIGVYSAASNLSGSCLGCRDGGTTTRARRASESHTRGRSAGIRSRRAGVGSSSRSSGRSRKPTDVPSRHRIITSGLIHSASSRTSLGPCSAERSSVRAVTGKSTTDRRPAATSAA